MSNLFCSLKSLECALTLKKKKKTHGVSVFVILSRSKDHYYDGESGTGYLAWRIKTIQRSTARDRRASYGGNTIILLEEEEEFYIYIYLNMVFFHFVQHHLKDHLVKMGLEDQLPDERPSLFQRLS